MEKSNKSMQTPNWRYIRILFISTGLIVGLQRHDEQIPLPLEFSLLVLIFVPLMALAVVAMNASRLPRFWNLPQWDTNPFILSSQPFQMLHVVAWQAILTGMVGYLSLSWTGDSSAGQATFFLASGVGFLLGLYLITRVFRQRFREKVISAKAVFLGSWQKPSK